jgi:uncharacterized repeat protein (TIGR01451 family)
VTNITGVTTVADGSGLLSITDNDSAVVAFNPVSVSQTEATTPMAFTVSLSNPVQSGVTLVLNSNFGSATVADFTTIVSGSVSFAPNTNTSQIVNVTINNDALDEDDESFTLTLSGLTAVGNVTLGTAVATGTILDDDQQLTTTTISSDLPDASVVGQPYAVVVDVDAVTLSPMGTVTVSDGSVSCGPVALVPGTAPNSSASCQLTSTTAGTKTLMATYAAASGAFAASSSTTAHQVNAASTAISVVGEARSRVNQPTTFTFAFSVEAPGAGTPAGTVTLSSGASTCNVTVPTGTASCALTFTALGARTVSTAFVPADGNFLGSSSSGPGNAQTLVFARSDLAVSNSNGINAYEPGDLIVYTVSVTNLGPDAAAQIRVRDTMPAGLIDVVWSCIANGGVLCPESGGVGDLDVVSTGFPVGGLLDFTFSGNVDGSPPQLINTALVELPADTTIEDLVPGNNSATDVDLLDGLFADGFESAAINASSAR